MMIKQCKLRRARFTNIAVHAGASNVGGGKMFRQSHVPDKRSSQQGITESHAKWKLNQNQSLSDIESIESEDVDSDENAIKEESKEDSGTYVRNPTPSTPVESNTLSGLVKQKVSGAA